MNEPGTGKRSSEALIGYHLGLDEPEDRAAFEAAHAYAEALVQARANLERVLRPLKSEGPVPVSEALVQGVLDRVSGTGRTIPFPKQQAGLQRGEEAIRRGGQTPFTLRELMGLAAAIALFVGVLVPSYSTARRTAQRMACMNQMRQLGAGYASYAEAHLGQMPFVGLAPPNAAWAAADSAGVAPAANSRHVFRLVKGLHVPPAVFVCPGRGTDRLLEPGGVGAVEDFPDPRNNSYSTHFVSRPWSRASFMNDMPLAADMNPLVEGGRLVPQTAPWANSRSHGHPGGQNVLRFGGGVFWAVRPDVGIQHDDIYRIEAVETYTGMERPRSDTDAFLIP